MEDKKKNNIIVIAISIAVLVGVVIFALLPNDFFSKDDITNKRKQMQVNTSDKAEEEFVTATLPSITDYEISETNKLMSETEETVTKVNDSELSDLEVTELTLGEMLSMVEDYKSSNVDTLFYDMSDELFGKGVVNKDYESCLSDTYTVDSIKDLFVADFILPEQVRGVFDLRYATDEDYKTLGGKGTESLVYVFADVEVVSFVDSNVAVCRVSDNCTLILKFVSLKSINIGERLSLPVLSSLLKVNSIGEETVICGYYLNGVI